MRCRRFEASAFVVLAVLLFGCTVTGCASTPATAPLPSTSSTPQPTPPSVVATLQFSGSDIQSLDADAKQIDAVEFDEGLDAVVSFIAESVDIEPTFSAQTDEGCAGPHTQYQWPGVIVSAWTEPGAFVVGIDEPVLGGIRLEATGGFAPGDNVATFSSAAPPENVGSLGGENTLMAFDVVARSTYGDYDSPVGVVGYAADGVTLDGLATPGEWSSFLC